MTSTWYASLVCFNPCYCLMPCEKLIKLEKIETFLIHAPHMWIICQRSYRMIVLSNRQSVMFSFFQTYFFKIWSFNFLKFCASIYRFMGTQFDCWWLSRFVILTSHCILSANTVYSLHSAYTWRFLICIQHGYFVVPWLLLVVWLSNELMMLY